MTMRLERLSEHRVFRHRASIVLVLLTAVLVTLTSLAAWTRATVLNTDHYVTIMTEISKDPDVIAAVSQRVAEQTVAALNVQSRVTEVLPPRAGFLAVPITTGIQEGVTRVIARTMASDGFQKVWIGANQRFHARLVTFLRGDAENATLEDGVLTIDLFPLVVSAVADLQATGVIPAAVPLPDLSADEDMEAARTRLGTALGVAVPADLGKVTVANAEALTKAQTAVRLLDALVFVLVFLTIAFAVAALVVSNRRWRTLAFLALAILATVPIIRLIMETLGSAMLSAVKTPTGEATLRAVFGKLQADLFWWLSLVVIVAVVLVIIGWLEGRPPNRQSRLASLDGRSLALAAVVIVLVWILLGIELALLLAVVVAVIATMRLPHGQITA